MSEKTTSEKTIYPQIKIYISKQNKKECAERCSFIRSDYSYCELFEEYLWHKLARSLRCEKCLKLTEGE